MADPLSVAASVVGLLTAAAQISQTLYNVTKRMKRAPKEIKDARTEVDDIRNVLSQLQLFVMGAAKASSSRTSLILVEQVVATLAATVTTFSALDVFVETLDSDENLGLMDRVRWLMKEKDLKELISKLQLHKSSMSLMLTILTCQSTIDAEEKVDRLCDLVEQTLKQNVMLAERLSSFQQGATVGHDQYEAATAGKTIATEAAPIEPDLDPGAQTESRKFVFEELLMNSRVYRNMAFDGTDTFSVLSSAGRTGTWSMLSGLSLSQMSNIAILALPIYASDLENKERYDFETITEEPVISATASIPDGPKQSPSSRKRIFSSLRKRFGAEPQDDASSPADSAPESPGIFGVEITTSIRYANVAISVRDESGEVYIYGYVPIIVAKCAVFLKEKGTNVEHVFAARGHPARVKSLEKIFDSPPRYGKGIPWDGFTVHDSAAVLLRYLKCLPEPVIPYGCYQKFTQGHRKWITQIQRSNGRQEFTDDVHEALVEEFQRHISELPPLSRQLLIYLLDILAVFASHSDVNKMEVARLVGVFHPSILSQPPQNMDEEEHRLAQDVVFFLVEWQDNWVVGMDTSKMTHVPAQT